MAQAVPAAGPRLLREAATVNIDAASTPCRTAPRSCTSLCTTAKSCARALSSLGGGASPSSPRWPWASNASPIEGSGWYSLEADERFDGRLARLAREGDS